MRKMAIQPVPAVFSSNRFLAEDHRFYFLQEACQISQSTLPDTSDVADGGNNRIRKLTPAVTVAVTVTSTPSSFNG